jgi:NAD(P)-dependent dehydrogenase (short-subunit alcohol dehydrogenase family)
MGVLDGKVAIVTGGTSGIGAHTVELFVSEGAKVVIAGRRIDIGEGIAERLGPATRFVRTDVTNESEVKEMIDCAVATYGRLDCLVNNAGGPPPSGTGGNADPAAGGSIATLDMEEYDATMAVILRGVVLGMKHAAAVMLHQGNGSIINIASIGGLRTGYSLISYSAAKAAVIHLTRCIAVELGEKGIRVNSISPGGILTGIFGKYLGLPDEVADRTSGTLESLFATMQPIPRAGLPEDVARAALYLASDASSFVNGHDLVVDGGLIAGQSFSRFNALVTDISGALQTVQNR